MGSPRSREAGPSCSRKSGTIILDPKREAAQNPTNWFAQALEDLVVRSEAIAQEVLSVLRSLSHKKDGTKHSSWVQAFRTVWNESKIQEMQSRLQSIRDALQFRILVSMKEDNIHGLDEASCKVLKDIVDSNRILKADIRTQTHNILTEQKVEGARAAGRHQEVLDAILTQHLKAPSVDTILQTLQSRLYSHRQDDRFEDIAQAHQKTFTWAFEKKNSSQSGPDLLNWLQSLSGTYWISGKAGSGKSTLMKYLVQDPRFKQALQEWAGDDSLVIATFYFWRAGAPIQRTQTGLLRSLLWQVLEQQPTMGSLLFPEQYVYGAIWTEFPTFHQLRRAFNRFANHITSSAVVPIKVAFIVDGLDEFEKDVIDFTGLADIFLTSSKSPNVKALVSSRPLPAFESSFESMPKLRLHDLTHGDITTYVETELGPHLRTTNSPALGSNSNADLLLSEIVDAAAGVFLWVKLVVRSLIEGVENGDTVEDLRTRLNALPRDLEDLFDHMIENVPDSYKEQSSQIFQLLEVCRTERIERPLSAVDLTFALNWNEASVLQAPIDTMPFAEKEKIDRDVDRRLKSRCVGLLELRTRIVNRAELNGSVLDEETQRQVAYLHRTVADYLSRPVIWQRILSWTAGTKFNASRLLLQSLIMGMKTNGHFEDPRDDYSTQNISRRTLWPTVEDALILAGFAENTGSVSICALLHELDRTTAFHFGGTYRSRTFPDDTWHLGYMDYLIHADTVKQSPVAWPTHENFLSLMVLYGLYYSLADVMLTHPEAMATKKGRPLLHYTCLPDVGPSHLGKFSRMTQLLLENGADPNQIFNNRSTWQQALEAYASTNSLRETPLVFLSALIILVKHGANPNACIYVSGQRQSALQAIRARFGNFSQGRLDGPAYTLVREYLKSRGVQMPVNNPSLKELTCLMLPEHKEDLRRVREMILDLITLLESKGAKAKAWRKENTGHVKIGGFRDRSSAYFTGRNWKDKMRQEAVLVPENLWSSI
jgi:hypothetical protein